MKYALVFLSLGLLLTPPASAGPKKHAPKKVVKKTPVKKAAPKPVESTLPPMIAEDGLDADGNPKPKDLPVLPANFAVRASFELKNGLSLAGATAFAVTMDGKSPVLLLPLNMFGWGGGRSEQIAPEILPTVLAKATVSSLDGSVSLGELGKPLLRDGKPTKIGIVKWVDVSEDISAFTLPKGSPVAALPLAEFSARQGERVWIVGRRAGEPGATPNLFGGSVAEDMTTLNIGVGQAITMDDPPEKWADLDGAPVVDRAGHVVGMYIASLQILGNPRYDPNKGYAAINPVRRLRRMLLGVK